MQRPVPIDNALLRRHRSLVQYLAPTPAEVYLDYETVLQSASSRNEAEESGPSIALT